MLEMEFSRKLEICKNNNSSFDGDFFMAVKSTGIFCLPSCRAKFPKPENIEFFTTKESAIDAGYRGCKRCRAADFPDTRPQWFRRLVDAIGDDPQKKMRGAELERISGKSIVTIRRYFHEYYGVSPAQYQRDQVLDFARERIMEGQDYRSIAFETGYESISGFRDAFVQKFGYTPGVLKHD